MSCYAPVFLMWSRIFDTGSRICVLVLKSLMLDSMPMTEITRSSSFILEEMVFRQARESDVDALASLVAERGFDYPTDISLVRQRFDDLTRAGDCILVAVYDSKIVAMALLHRTRFLHRLPDGRISSLVVSETYRSHGIGARLVEAAEKVFRDWGCGRIEVSSGAKREAAHRFYVRMGFTEQPKRFIKTL